MNSQNNNTNSKGDFVLKNSLKRSFKDIWYTKINQTHNKFNGCAFKVKNSLHTQ